METEKAEDQIQLQKPKTQLRAVEGAFYEYEVLSMCILHQIQPFEIRFLKRNCSLSRSLIIRLFTRYKSSGYEQNNADGKQNEAKLNQYAHVGQIAEDARSSHGVVTTTGKRKT